MEMILKLTIGFFCGVVVQTLIDMRKNKIKVDKIFFGIVGALILSLVGLVIFCRVGGLI